MRISSIAVVGALSAIMLIGCNMSKPYVMNVDRVDQKLEGNRGYLKGTPPPAKDRGDLKRPLIAVDIDLPDVNEGKTALVLNHEKPSQASAQTETQQAPASAKSAAREDANIK